MKTLLVTLAQLEKQKLASAQEAAVAKAASAAEQVAAVASERKRLAEEAAAARRDADAQRAWLREKRAEADARFDAAESASADARAAARCGDMFNSCHGCVPPVRRTVTASRAAEAGT